jgi:hypothetical protein
MPFLSTVFFAGYRKDLGRDIKRIAIYLIKLEKSFADPNLGWETHLIGATEEEILKGFRTTKRTLTLLMIFTFVFGVWRTVFFGLKDIVGIPF